MAWEISIPNSLEPGLYDGLEVYDTKEEAIAVAKEVWGADDNGMVSIVNELPDDEEGTCENCGAPCEYDSDMCLCDECKTELYT